MSDKKANSVAALALALIFSGPANAAVVWNESINGNLSNNPLAPTALTFAPGPNDVIGEAGNAPLPGGLAPFGQDFFTFTVPTGYELSSLTAVTVDLFTPGDMFAFIAIQSGPQITHDVSPPSFGGSAAGLLGWRHVAPGDQGTDILPAMGVAGDGATGFMGLLGAGQYSVWVQDDKPFDYDFSFKISSVPEPFTWVMMLGGLVALGFIGHRSRAVSGVRYASSQR
jgi:hypothetical protein